MNTKAAGEQGLERLLARVLRTGTWVGSVAIATGWALRCMGWGHLMSALTCMRTMTLGIALIILLPVLRVLLMALAFVRRRDFLIGAVATGVLAVIAVAALIDMRIN